MYIQSLIPEWQRWLRGKGHRPRGIDSFVHKIRRFLSWLGPEALVSSLTSRTVESYRSYLGECVAAPTISNALSAIRNFSRWCMRCGYLSADPTSTVDFPKKSRPAPRPLQHGQLRRLMLVLTETDDMDSYSRWMLQRNRRAIFLMLYGGMRISEVAALRWGDVDLESRVITVREGKHGRDRTIPIHSAIVADLELVHEDLRQPDSAVVTGRGGGPLSWKSIGHIFERWLPSHGLKISSHQLRHTFATELLRRKTNIRIIQRMLGHASLETTEWYLGFDVCDALDAVEALPCVW